MLDGPGMRKEPLLIVMEGFMEELESTSAEDGSPGGYAKSVNLHMVELNNIYGSQFNQRFDFMDHNSASLEDVKKTVSGIVSFIRDDLDGKSSQ